jgi:O-antigen/teichoic acid export membrane protein
MLARLGLNFGAQLITVTVGFLDRFLVVGLLIRAMGNEAYADWTLLLSTAGLLAFGELGLNIYYGNVWQHAYTMRDKPSFQRMLRVSLACSTVLGVALVGVAAIVLGTIDLSAVLSLKSLAPSEAALTFFLLAAAISSRAARGGISQLYRGRQRFARGTIIDLLFPATLVLAMPIAAFAGGSLAALAAVYLACDLVAGWGVMLLDLRCRFPDLSFRPGIPTRPELNDLVRHVRWFAIQQGAPVAWLQVPVLVLGSLAVTSSALISFVILRTLVNFVRQLASMLSISAGVELAGSLHAGHRNEVARRLAAFGAVLSGSAAAFATAIAIFGELFVGLWTGQPGLFDREIVTWLLVAALIAAPATPLGAMMMLANLPKPAALANLVQLGVGLSAVALLAHLNGAPGAAAGLAIGEAIAFGLVLPALAAKHLGLDYLRYLAHCIWIMSISALWCGGVGLTVSWLVDPATVVGFVTAALLWGILGLVPALLAALPAAQRAKLVAAWRPLRHQ